MSSSTISPRRTRYLRPVCALTLASLALAACGGSSTGESSGDEDVTLFFAWWGDDSRADRYEQSIDLFEEEHSGVTIQTSYAGFSDYWTARNTEAAGGALPDVIQMDISYLSTYGESGRVASLDEFIGDQIDLSTMPESVLPAGQIDGTTYGIVTSTNTLSTFVDTDVTEALGVEVPPAEGLTWDVYHQFLQDVAEAGANESPAVYGSVDYTGFFWLFQMWLGQQGLDLFTEDGQLGFTEADLAQWWSHTADLRDDQTVMPANRQEQITVDAAASGEVAADISWDNFLVRFNEGSGGDSYTMLPVPAGEDGNTGMFLKPGLLLSVSAQSEHPDVAAEFIDFIVNDPRVSEIFGTSRGVPASETSREGIDATDLDQQILDYEDSVADLVGDTPPPPVDGFGTLEESFIRLHENVNYGASTPEEAAAAWFTEAQSALG